MRRRSFVGGMSLSAFAGLLPAGLLSGGYRPAPAPSSEPLRPEPDAMSLTWLLGPIVGRALPGGYRVASISDVERGACTITLLRDGATSHVQAFRRSALDRGLATSALLDLRWMNGADGAHVTEEAAGIAVMTLAAHVRRVERTLRSGEISSEERASLRALTTHAERRLVHGGFPQQMAATGIGGACG